MFQGCGSGYSARMETVVQQGNPESSSEFDLIRHNAAAMEWVVDALLDGDVAQSAALFDQPIEVQFLAVQLLRTAARGALHTGGLDGPAFLAALCGTWSRWINDEHRENGQHGQHGQSAQRGQASPRNQATR